MVTHRRGQTHTQRESEGNPLTDNHAKLMAAMTNLVNTIQASTAMTTHAMWRTRQSAKNKNREGAEDRLDGVSRTLAAFLKVDSPVFSGSTNPTEADNWFQAVESALRTQHVPYDQFMEYVAYQLVEKLNNGGKESTDCYTNRIWTLHRRYSRQLSTISTFLS
ncbi:hypothetical protein AHAS_Ahas05G0048900 [Arachis hypogaea]